MTTHHAANDETIELVVGLEVHRQLKTASKIFCGCSTEFGSAPNANTCPVCLGLPGALPVLNQRAVELAVVAALALECTIHDESVFARKNYFYPDLPKGYQISQFEKPIATDGRITLDSTRQRSIRIRRLHMEEDAGKSLHDRFDGFTAIDLDRAGTPLVEIVSEPDIRSAEEAVQYLRILKQTLEFTGASDANMEEGSLRVDVNISIRAKGDESLGTRTEVKNLNTFSGVERAIRSEFARQIELRKSGIDVVQQTMLWDANRNEVRITRMKESSHDYRYFPDPDLLPLVLQRSWIAQLQANIPELPQALRERLQRQYSLNSTDVELLAVDRDVVDYFERTAELVKADFRRIANWLTGPIQASINASSRLIRDYPVSPERLAMLLDLEASGTVSNTAARQILVSMETEIGTPLEIATRDQLLQVSDDSELTRLIDEVISENSAEAERFRSGERKLLGVLVGLVMKKSGGSADPRRVNQLISSRLG